VRLTRAAQSLLVFAIGASIVIFPGCLEMKQSQPEPIDYSLAWRQARDTLVELGRGPDNVARAQAIEAIAETLGDQEGELFLEALGDENPAIRFAAAMAIGDVRYAPAKPYLLKMAADKKVEPNRFVFCAVIYALYQLSNTDYTGHLGRLVFDREKEVRASAVLAMGKMGEPSAIELLKKLYAQEQDPTVRLRAVEAMAMLGDLRSVNLLEAYTKSQFMDERIDAITSMARAPGPRTVFVLQQILSNQRQQPYVRIAAAEALGRLGKADEQAYELCVLAAQDPEGMLRRQTGSAVVGEVQVASLQQLAAHALGWIGRVSAVRVLQPLLNSQRNGVRVASAASILRLLPGYAQSPSELSAAVQQPTVEQPEIAPTDQAPVALPQEQRPVQQPGPDLEAQPTKSEPVLPEPTSGPAYPRWTPRPSGKRLYRAGGKD